MKKDDSNEISWAFPGSVKCDADGIHHLVGSRCNHCDTLRFPAADVCPTCMKEDIAEALLSTTGTLYSWTIVHVGRKGWPVPYAIGYIDLTDGVRVLAPLDYSPEYPLQCNAKVGMKVGQLRTDDDQQPIWSHRFSLIEEGALK